MRNAMKRLPTQVGDYSITFTSRKEKLMVRLRVKGKDVKSKLEPVFLVGSPMKSDSREVWECINGYTKRFDDAMVILEVNPAYSVISHIFQIEETVKSGLFSSLTGSGKCLPFLEYAGKKVQFSDITNEMLILFKEWLEDEDYATNTVRRYMMDVRGVLTEAKDRGYEFPANLYAKILKGRYGVTTSVYLTRNELAKLYSILETGFIGHRPVTDEESTALCRFLIGAYTGARYSDFTKISSKNIVKDTAEGKDGQLVSSHCFSYYCQKIKKMVNVPVSNKAIELVSMPYLKNEISISKINSIIPSLCIEAGITEKVAVRKADKEEVGQKGYFVRSHTARKSFATNLYISGAELEKIASWMGHASPTITYKSYLVCKMIDENNTVRKCFD